MNYIKLSIALVFCIGLSQNQVLHAGTAKPNQWVYYGVHAAGAFLYSQVEQVAISFAASFIQPENPFTGTASNSARSPLSEGRLSVLLTLVRLYGLFKLPGLINKYIFKDTQERSTSTNLQSLMIRVALPYQEISAPVSEYLVDGYQALKPQAV